jgi:transposase
MLMGQVGRVRAHGTNNRLIVEAIVWLDRTGAPWQDLPSQFGPWGDGGQPVYRWRRQGI